MSIMIDRREGSYQLAAMSPLSPYLDPCPECLGSATHCKSCRETGKLLYQWEAGDIFFTGKGPDGDILIGIEVKSWEEFITSLISQRFQSHQIPLMVETFQVRWLLLYGRIRKHPDYDLVQSFHPWYNKWHTVNTGTVQFTYTKLIAFLAGPSFTNFFHYDHVESKEAIPNWIIPLYLNWNKPWNSHRALKVINGSTNCNADTVLTLLDNQYGSSTQISGIIGIPDPYFKFKMAFLSAFPGIKYERAKAIAKRFYNIEEMCEASIQDWADIEVPSSGSSRVIKLGIKNAERIYGLIHQKEEVKQSTIKPAKQQLKQPRSPQRPKLSLR